MSMAKGKYVIPLKAEDDDYQVKTTHITPVRETENIEADIAQMKSYCKNDKHSSNSDRTIKTYVGHIRWMYKRFGTIKYSKEFARQVRQELDGLVEDGKLKSGTEYVALYALENLFRACWDPEFYIGKPKVTCDEALYHSHNEIEKMLNKTEHPRNKAMLSLLYFAALRNGEVCNIYLSDYDPVKHIVHIRDHPGWHPKTYQARKIPVPMACAEHLQKWLEVRQKNVDKLEAGFPYMFFTMRGSRLKSDDVAYTVRIAGKKADIDTHPHAWRHSRISYLLNVAKLPRKTVMRLTGHKNDATLAIYDHSSDDDLYNAINAIREISV
jgi:integrase/recombinase XerD